MSVEFSRGEDGEVWYHATAGGHGGGATSVFSCPATDEHFTQYPREHAAFLASDVPPSEPEAGGPEALDASEVDPSDETSG